jgi:hypothetical protein
MLPIGVNVVVLFHLAQNMTHSLTVQAQSIGEFLVGRRSMLGEYQQDMLTLAFNNIFKMRLLNQLGRDQISRLTKLKLIPCIIAQVENLIATYTFEAPSMVKKRAAGAIASVASKQRRTRRTMWDQVAIPKNPKMWFQFEFSSEVKDICRF